MSILPESWRIALQQRWQNTLSHLLPGSCLLCGADSRHALLCPACQASLPVLPATCCPQCSLPTTHGERCGACLAHPPAFDRVSAGFAYDFPVDRLIQALKYGHQTAIAGHLGKALLHHLDADDFDLIVPLPLHPQRLRERGFNQSVEIARGLARQLKRPLDTTSLTRTRPTPPQAHLPLKERQANVRGAFSCSRDFSGRRLLLVDDVMTTGATVNECSRILRLHGALTVHVAVVARALRH